MDDIINKAKEIIHTELARAGYRPVRILLVGSRARGQPRPDSDWDFFVIIDRQPPDQECWDLVTRITGRFAQAGFCGDVIIKSLDVVQKQKDNTGCITHYLLRDGVDI